MTWRNWRIVGFVLGENVGMLSVSELEFFFSRLNLTSSNCIISGTYVRMSCVRITNSKGKVLPIAGHEGPEGEQRNSPTLS